MADGAPDVIGAGGAGPAPDVSAGAGSTPVLQGSPGSSKGQAKIQPALYSLIRGMISPPMQAPAPGQMARPVGRLDTFENFLGNFLYSLGQGFAQEGHGPGAAMRGAGAAATAPLGLAGFQSELAQRQAQTQQTQAQSGLLEQQKQMMGQSVPITMPNGQQALVPQAMLGKILPGLASAQGRVGAAEASGQYHLAGEKLKLMAAMGQIGKVEPDGQGGYVAFNKFGKPLGSLDGAVDMQTLKDVYGRTTTSEELKQQSDGSWVAVPRTSTTRANIPAAKAAGTLGGPAKFPSRGVGGGGSARLVLGPEGRPLVTDTNTTRSMIEAAPKVMDLANRTEQLINQQIDKLGPMASRWEAFMSRKVGAPNPEFTKLLTNIDLMSTLLMRMHVGARGGVEIMNHFQHMIDAGKQSPQNLLAAIGEIKTYANEVQASGGAQGTSQNPKAGNKALDPLGIR